MTDLSLLSDEFDLFFNKAKQAQGDGKIELAKRNYLLAAEAMMKMAKESAGEVKKARLERARRLIELSDNLRQPSRAPVSGTSSAPRPGPRAGDEAGAGGSREKDESETQWAAARIPDLHFSDIAGLEEVKHSITVRMINSVKYPEKYDLYNKKSGGGVLLFGPPGTGKTMIAKAIACEVGAVFFAVKGSDVMSKWVGESERNISGLFEAANREKRAIIFIDEIDSLLGRRGNDTHNDKRVNEFLQQIDGFAGRNPNLLLLGATNRPWDVDDAAMRPGRFSQKIYVPLPDAPARKFMLNKNLKGVPVGADVDLDELVALSDGYSGADIEELCDRAKEGPLMEAISDNTVVEVRRSDFLKALAAVRPSVDKKTVKEYEAYAGIKPRQSVTLKKAEFRLLPGEKTVLELICTPPLPGASAEIDGKRYAAEGPAGTPVVSLLLPAGNYTARILTPAGEEAALLPFKIVCGFEEDDMGL